MGGVISNEHGWGSFARTLTGSGEGAVCWASSVLWFVPGGAWRLLTS